MLNVFSTILWRLRAEFYFQLFYFSPSYRIIGGREFPISYCQKRNITSPSTYLIPYRESQIKLTSFQVYILVATFFIIKFIILSSYTEKVRRGSIIQFHSEVAISWNYCQIKGL
jgi:hypothetical protein